MKTKVEIEDSNPLLQDDQLKVNGAYELRFVDWFADGNEIGSDIVQTQNGKTRILHERIIKLWANPSRKIYTLTEVGAAGVREFIYLVSDTAISKNSDLFSFEFESRGYTYSQDTERIRKRLFASINSRWIDGGAFLKNAEFNDPKTICIDWYEVWFDIHTEEIVDEVFLFSRCYDISTTGGGPGGGAIPPPSNTEESDVSGSSVEVDDVPEDNNAPRTVYTYPGRLVRNRNTREILIFTQSNTTAAPMVCSFFNNGVPVTRS